MARRPEHHLGRRVLLVGVNPVLAENLGGNAPLGHAPVPYLGRDFRGPWSAACMRAVCPVVNMNMASSST